MRSQIIVAGVGVFLLLGCGPALAQKLPWHPKQGEALSGIGRVLIAPPAVHVERWSVRSGELAEGTAETVHRTICGMLDQVLEERQVVVDDYLLCLGESESSEVKRAALAVAAGHFRQMADDWALHRNEQKLEDFHLGDEASEVKKLAVDAVILVSANGIVTTKGERAMNATVIGGGGPGQSLVLHLGVIRPQSGELVFFTENVLGGDFLRHPERLDNAIEKAMGAVFGRAAAGQKDSKN